MRIFILSAILIVAMACQSKKADTGRARAFGPVNVDGFVVERHSISDKVEVPGSLLPFEETQIRPEVSGRVVDLNIPEGSIVPKGTILVKLFDQDLRAQLSKLEVQLQINEKNKESQGELLKI